MDTNFVFLFLITLIIIVLIVESQEAVLLLSLGFFTFALFFNLDNIFSLTVDSYKGWGRAIQMLYLLLPLISIVKSYYTAQAVGFDVFFGRTKRVK